MLIDEKKLKNVEVKTQSGQYLGRVSGIELETDTSLVEKYRVKSNVLFGEDLLISKSHIINFDDKKMIVEDGVVKISTKDKKILKQLESTSPIITSKEF
ncbi:MAG: PRC-barrel domain-containing protein [Patescibacteria group bacterium]|nr:PRC-barrel domain-containing protein [Patescibacteria group bacterium]